MCLKVGLCSVVKISCFFLEFIEKTRRLEGSVLKLSAKTVDDPEAAPSLL